MKMNKTIKIKKLYEDAKLPIHGSAAAAGYDAFAYINPLNEPVVIAPHETEKINTGIAIQVPEGYFMAIFARSGLATKEGLRPANCVGVVDSDYRGPVIVALHNDSDQVRFVNSGDRIAQLVILPYLSWNIEEIDELDETERGTGGFGSTGK